MSVELYRYILRRKHLFGRFLNSSLRTNEAKLRSSFEPRELGGRFQKKNYFIQVQKIASIFKN